MAQIILPNVLEEQTVIVGPQYAERLIYHNRCSVQDLRILPDCVEKEDIIWAIKSADNDDPYRLAGI